MRYNKNLRSHMRRRERLLSSHAPRKHWLGRSVTLILGVSVLGAVLAKTQTTFTNPEPSKTSEPLQTQWISEEVNLPDSHNHAMDDDQSAALESTVSEIALAATQPDNPPKNLNNNPAAIPEPEDKNWKEVLVIRGDNPSKIFSKLGIHTHLREALTLPEVKTAFKNIRPGELIKVKKEGRKFSELYYSLSKTRHLHIKNTAEGLTAKYVEDEVETRRVNARGTVNSSLFQAGKDAGLSDNLVMQLVKIFAFDIDFALDIRKGDEFSVVYDERYAKGSKLKDGPIIAARFNSQGKTFQAIHYTDHDGNSDYYTSDGRSLKKAFIRTPVKFARISSHFNPRRMHPILHKFRAHKGVDYAAPTGTPVKTTGYGKIEFIGTKGGYGKTIVVKHDNNYSTLYAHLSRFRKGLSTGQKVRQGDIIGYVGRSGRATGPHLHYEFRIKGVHKNPLTVKLPKANPLSKKELAEFKQYAKPLLAQLDNNTLKVASSK